MKAYITRASYIDPYSLERQDLYLVKHHLHEWDRRAVEARADLDELDDILAVLDLAELAQTRLRQIYEISKSAESSAQHVRLVSK